MTPDERFESLWTDFLEGTLAPDGIAELQTLLAEHSHLQSKAADLLQTHRLLGFDMQVGAASREAFTRGTLARLPKSDAAFVGSVIRELKPTAARPRFSWLKWSGIAAGFLFGILCTSVVWAYSAPSFSKSTSLLEESFESGPAPRATSVPTVPGHWDGDYSEIVGEQQGVTPSSGTRMLRFLRADYEGKPNAAGSYVSSIYRLIDMGQYRKELADGRAVVQVSAELNTFAFPAKEKYCGSVAMFALSAEMASSLTSQSEVLTNGALAMGRKVLPRLDRDPRTWERVDGELRLPPETEFLLIQLQVVHATREQQRVTFDGHFLDDVRVTLARRNEPR